MKPQFYRFKSKVFSGRQTVLAVLCLLIGYFTSCAIPVFYHPAAGCLATLLLLSLVLITLKVKKQRLTPACRIACVITGLLALAIIFSEDNLIGSLSFLLAFANICFLISAAYGNRLENGFSDYIYIDYILALLTPLYAVTAIFDALFSRFSGKSNRYLGKILLGIAIAVIPTILIFSYLSYDEAFLSIVQDIFSFDFISLYNTLAKLCLGVLIGMYLFGLFVSSEDGYQKDRLSVQRCQSRFARLRILPQITALSAAVPIAFLYVIFFISQWQYYVSGFAGDLPQQLTYAEYAREGFFQLCAVSVINLIVIVAFSLFIRRGQAQNPPVLKLLTSVFCLFTLVLISTAVAKLVMYIDTYGLTAKRIYAMWAMAVIALVFLVIAIGQFVPRLKTVALSLCITAILFTGLSVCNINTLTAQYNADRYLSGTLEAVDLEAMQELGASAIPALTELMQASDTVIGPDGSDIKGDIHIYLQDYSGKYTQGTFNFFQLRVSDYLAMDALAEYGLLD